MANPQFSSQWLSMNVLSLDHERVLVDAQQTELIRKLEEWGFSPIPIPFDHVRARSAARSTARRSTCAGAESSSPTSDGGGTVKRAAGHLATAFTAI